LHYKVLLQMKDLKEIESDLASIKNMMERSSRFISLSGLSGVLAGIYAIIGSLIAYYLIYYPNSPFGYRFYYVNENDIIVKLMVTAFCVLGASLGTGVLLTIRKAKKQGLSFWDNNSKRFLINISIPLVAGGIFIFSLLIRGYFGIAAPACLLFYGLALINGSSYTLGDVRNLGLLQIALGLLCSVFPGYGLIFWTIGFGGLHIVYGIMMHNKYDK
jgi:MFS family permease